MYSIRKTKALYLSIIFAIGLLSALFVLIYFKMDRSRQLNASVDAFSYSQSDVHLIDDAIRLLYQAEDNMRIHAITGDSNNAKQFRAALEGLIFILDSLDRSSSKQQDFVTLLSDKETKTHIYIKARALSDSLWNRSEELIALSGSRPLYQTSKPAKINIRPTRRDTTVKKDITKDRKPKRLFGRIKDAILNKSNKKRDTVVKVIATTHPSTASLSATNDIAVDGSWYTLLSKLLDNQGILQQKELNMLRSNEQLFGQLKALLLTLQDKAVAIAHDKTETLHMSNEQFVQHSRIRAYITIIFIVLLTAAIIWMLWRLFRNNEIYYNAKIQAERIALVKKKVAMVLSHEARGPVHSILASLQWLKHAPRNQEQQEAYNTIQLSAQSLLSVVNNVLEYGKAESGKLPYDKAPFYPAKAINDIANGWRLFAQNKQLFLNASLDIPQELCVQGNEFYLERILSNLIFNAIKFTKQGGVTIHATTETIDKKNTLLHLAVTDTGQGIKKEDLQKIFELFGQAATDPTQITAIHGNGLGLALVKELVYLHKGKIAVKSTPGQGSTFTITLPYKITNKKALPKPETQRRAVSLSGKQVLIAENDPIHRKYLQTILAKKDITYYFVENGQQALIALHQQHFELALIDVNMPVMDGNQLISKIREMNNPIPIIILSASPFMDLGTDGHQPNGVDDFLVKPYTEKELFMKIEKIFS